MHFRKERSQVGLTAKLYTIVPISPHDFDERKTFYSGLREYEPSAFLSGKGWACRLESFCWFKLCGICSGEVRWCMESSMALQDESNGKYGTVARNRKNVRRAEVDGKPIKGLEVFRYTLWERCYRESFDYAIRTLDTNRMKRWNTARKDFITWPMLSAIDT